MSTVHALTPGTSSTFVLTSSKRSWAQGQPIAVSVILISTFPSSMPPSETSPSDMMARPVSGSGQVAGWASICWRRSPDAGAWVVSMVSAIPLILVPDLDVDIPVLDRYRVGLRRDDRWEARDLAGAEVEARAVSRTFDRHVPELPLTERILLVSAGVPNRIEVVVFGVDEADRFATDLHAHHRLLRQLTSSGDSLPGHAIQSGRPVHARTPPDPA